MQRTPERCLVAKWHEALPHLDREGAIGIGYMLKIWFETQFQPIAAAHLADEVRSILGTNVSDRVVARVRKVLPRMNEIALEHIQTSADSAWAGGALANRQSELSALAELAVQVGELEPQIPQEVADLMAAICSNDNQVPTCISPSLLPIAIGRAGKGCPTQIQGVQKWIAPILHSLSRQMIHSNPVGKAPVEEIGKPLGSVFALTNSYINNGQAQIKSIEQHKVLEKIQRMVQQGHKVVLLTAGGFSGRATPEIRSIRELLIETNLYGVIGLPAIFSYSMAREQVISLRAQNGANRTVRMVDANQKHFRQLVMGKGRRRALNNIEEIVRTYMAPEAKTGISRDVSREEIARNAHRIEPQRYVLGISDNTLGKSKSPDRFWLLEDIAEIIRPQSLRQIGTKEHQQVNQRDEISIYEIGPSDVCESGIIETANSKSTVRLTESTEKRLAQQTLKVSDILLCYKQRIGTIGIIGPSFPDSACTASQSMVILRVKPGWEKKIKSDTLFMQLRSQRLQKWLHEHATTQSVPLVTMSDLRRMPIAQLNENQCEELRARFAQYAQCYAEIDRLRRQAQDLISEDR